MSPNGHVFIIWLTADISKQKRKSMSANDRLNNNKFVTLRITPSREMIYITKALHAIPTARRRHSNVGTTSLLMVLWGQPSELSWQRSRYRGTPPRLPSYCQLHYYNAFVAMCPYLKQLRYSF